MIEVHSMTALIYICKCYVASIISDSLYIHIYIYIYKYKSAFVQLSLNHHLLSARILTRRFHTREACILSQCKCLFCTPFSSLLSSMNLFLSRASGFGVKD